MDQELQRSLGELKHVSRAGVLLQGRQTLRMCSGQTITIYIFFFLIKHLHYFLYWLDIYLYPLKLGICILNVNI